MWAESRFKEGVSASNHLISGVPHGSTQQLGFSLITNVVKLSIEISHQSEGEKDPQIICSIFDQDMSG